MFASAISVNCSMESHHTDVFMFKKQSGYFENRDIALSRIAISRYESRKRRFDSRAASWKNNLQDIQL